MPGEEQWLIPLRGRSRCRWYWPSKYLHMDFSLRHYLAMQLRRMEAPKQHPCVAQLWDSVKLVEQNRKQLEQFMATVDEDTLRRSTTLQDAHALIRMVAGRSPVPYAVEDGLQDAVAGARYEPFVKYALRPLSKEETGGSPERDLVRERNQFRQMLLADPGVMRSLRVRNRFVDALYLRRRAYYLEKLARKKPVGETIQKYRRHFTVHPDNKAMWPDNKGIAQHSWPAR